MFNLTGTNALVTGATGGLGLAIVRKLHEAGANVIASATKLENLNKLKSEYQERLSIIKCDLANPTETETLLDQAEEIAGEISIVVCNAGLCRDNLAMRMSDEEWDTVLNINLTSVFRLNRAAIKKMIRRGYGRIINISSVVGLTGNIGQANYTATKAGLIGMSKSLAAEIATRGITINCVAPGFIKTPMTEHLPQEIKDSIIKKIPVAKMGHPGDIANGVLFLALRESAYITGQTLHINGGMLMV
ncbi:MAG: 3-oxoacyl-[acyl-carrier-protein] reductase [Candidatus Midichloria mitochondrii]|uniref:3-oxoacyl-[acyl-carrier-protein] reductase n=1 Tax=Midichloria mitochondrii (strain IricVA) TaxID=696127 RepID=F7XUB8_MIDMI|nr:3-oxoacyl-[acyl-carrier-protein] reductase [Candidatus Midichloria mitochondrii]AEI89477.1 3-oxoacyl-(acyl-carrier-protein) reductase [Candidatus Midichloria mitochondrii IricVA]MDJ1256724.1 3-oxoacyl-[acyl-carrier-protein] reductase [Candidatus Midichloria mitochondrii]MDJ1288415.1 3-oxoacyl-[acyl-carrier-protein] reductase [Candidatus Midichloria mitochondrii]MDJ1299262.1 3-oxoacyl-[acyl-carrier-protein] reductase [Candidatus Midichloria mitochondrii]MDJ1313405.1 3-oxoacyl-[acyl-carrier-p